MQAGNLNRRLTIEAPGEGYDEAGQPIEGWTPVATVWADIRHTSGLEAIRGGAETSISRASIRIRYRSGLHSGMRATAGGVTYRIEAVLPDVSRREYMDLVCEVVNGY